MNLTFFTCNSFAVYCIPAGWIWGDHGFLNFLGVVDIAGNNRSSIGVVILDFHRLLRCHVVKIKHSDP